MVRHPLKGIIGMVVGIFVDEEGREYRQALNVDALPKFYEDEEMTNPKKLNAHIGMFVSGNRIRMWIVIDKNP